MSDPSQSITAEEREALGRLVRGFVRREIIPNIDVWEAACEFPRKLYARAGDLGLLGLGFPEQYGGLPGDQRSMNIVVNELMQAALTCRRS